MRKLLYTMHFRGRASLAAGERKSLRTTGTATSCIMTTAVAPSGVETEVKACEGDLAFLELQMHVNGDGSFREDGAIIFGEDDENVLRFSAIGEGHLSPVAQSGMVAGTVSCNITGGEGQFAGASGFISSNFTLTATGELNDFHAGLIFLAA